MKHPPRISFGLRIKQLRDEQGITQEELAERVGLFRTYMSRVETGVANPTLDVIVALADALAVPVQTLFEPAPGAVPRRTRSATPMSRGRVTR